MVGDLSWVGSKTRGNCQHWRGHLGSGLCSAGTARRDAAESLLLSESPKSQGHARSVGGCQPGGDLWADRYPIHAHQHAVSVVCGACGNAGTAGGGQQTASDSRSISLLADRQCGVRIHGCQYHATGRSEDPQLGLPAVEAFGFAGAPSRRNCTARIGSWPGIAASGGRNFLGRAGGCPGLA